MHLKRQAIGMQPLSQRSQHYRRQMRYLLAAMAALTAVLIGLGHAPAVATAARHYTELEFPPPPEVELPDYTRFEMDNGIVVYLMEDHELPLVSGSAMFYTGDRLEPAEKVGLASIVGEVMRSGGTREHPADLLNQLLEQRAASVETGIDTTTGSASFSSLTEDLTDVFGWFAEVIRAPAFPQDKIDLSKKQWQGTIARRNDDPEGIADREFNKLIYGADSPYARTVEYRTLSRISREDLIGFYQQYFHPNNMLLGIVGDFEPDQMRALIEAEFGDWQPAFELGDRQQIPTAAQVKQGGIFLVDQPQLTQSYIQMGHLGGKFDNPDYPALSVLNEVLNGFGGRLVNEVRSRQGLAYVVYAVWSPRFDFPGLFIGGGQTRSEATVPFIQSMFREIEAARMTPVTEAELARAKDSVLNAFIFNFQTPGQTLSRLMRYEYYGYPADFIFQYQRQVAATTAEAVQQAAQTYLNPEQIVTLVVGNTAAIEPPLSTLGVEVAPVDISIPSPA
jgi:zinc protease